MRLAYVDLCGFRGFRKRIRIEFADRATIIDGRNGVGKSTIFDAVEYALTGAISKYKPDKAAGQTVSDYLWWAGGGIVPEERYVDVGFTDGPHEISLRRTPFDQPDTAKLREVAAKLCDLNLAPGSPLNQLCSACIIRDEHIASLSLDLTETERYAILRDALGANDAEVWIKRAARVGDLAKRRAAGAQQEVGAANTDVAMAARRIDEVRARLFAEETMAGAVQRLRAFASTEAAPDRLAGPVREQLAAAVARAEALQTLASQWSRVAEERFRLEGLAQAREAADRDKGAAASALAAASRESGAGAASALAAAARDLVELVSLGRRLGLKDGGCPLCTKTQSDAEFQRGMSSAEALAHRLDAEAAAAAQREAARRTAEERLAAAERKAQSAAAEHLKVVEFVEQFDSKCRILGFAKDTTLKQVETRSAELHGLIDSVQKDLRILETLSLSTDLERAQHAEAESKSRLARAEEKSGRARKAQAAAQALHDAARRAAGETLDQRLDRVLPLLSELYRRLRPHAVWGDIEYSIRGDVRRFLRLQVGEDLNPQFLYSSGQRRATGLAFLLSINISLAWGRWRSILLDDPVQHVDDYRAIHVAEVCAQLAKDGRQIICAVEDAALADLLCRRLPFDRMGDAKRITLGPDADGALAKLNERELNPLISRSLLASAGESVAG